jgi:hypothetical protein
VIKNVPFVEQAALVSSTREEKCFGCSLSTTAFCAAGRALISSASRFKFENFSQWPLTTTHSTAGSGVIALPFAVHVFDLSHGFRRNDWFC